MTNQFNNQGITLLNYEEDLPTTTRCPACNGKGLTVEWEGAYPEEVACDYCEATGQIERHWLQEALQIVSGVRRYDEPKREHLVALATHYRECLGAFSGSDTPAALDRITVQLETIGQTCLELARV
jgi:hypothetical protein